MSKIDVGIIGGAGFVGSYLQERSKNSEYGFEIYDKNVNKPNVKYVDVTDLESLNKLPSMNCLINLAAEHKDNVEPISEYERVNVHGARNVCKFCNLKKINKIIFTSSVAIYGNSKDPCYENSKINYFNEYGRTKYEAEKIYLDWFNEDPINRDLIIIRPTVIFGPGNRGNVYNLLNQIYKKRFVQIGSGKNIKSIAYVRNIADFIHESIGMKNKNMLPLIVNYADKPDMEIQELVKLIKKELGYKETTLLKVPFFLAITIGKFFDFISLITRKDFPISSIRVKKFIMNTVIDSKYLESIYKSAYPLEEALKDTINFEFGKNK